MRITTIHGFDPQRRRPVAECTVCGRGLHKGESCYQINGGCYCADCLLPMAQLYFAAHRRICGEEERE